MQRSCARSFNSLFHSNLQWPPKESVNLISFLDEQNVSKVLVLFRTRNTEIQFLSV